MRLNPVPLPSQTNGPHPLTHRLPIVRRGQWLADVLGVAVVYQASDTFRIAAGQHMRYQ